MAHRPQKIEKRKKKAEIEHKQAKVDESGVLAGNMAYLEEGN